MNHYKSIKNQGKIFCRSQDRVPIYLDGYCDNSRSCVCTNQQIDPFPITTTTANYPVNTTAFSGICKFRLTFENDDQILVVNEGDLNAIVIITIVPNIPNCVLQNSVTLRVSSKQYTAKENVDYEGDLV